MSAVATPPSLSQLVDWPTEHLTDAAEHREAVAERNYGLANQVWQDALSVDWQGDAADALRTATHSDMIDAERGSRPAANGGQSRPQRRHGSFAAAPV